MTKEQQREYARRKYEEALPAYHALMSCYPLTLEDLPGEIWKDIEGYFTLTARLKRARFMCSWPKLSFPIPTVNPK